MDVSVRSLHNARGLLIRSTFAIWWMLLSFSLPVIGRGILIPDPQFKAFLVSNYDLDLDGEISSDEAAAVTGLLNCSFQDIDDLTGIEAFINIQQLYCFANNLEGLPDLSSLTQLKILDCSSNNIEELPHLCELVALEHLLVHNNMLEELPIVDNLPNLVELTCHANNFSLCNFPAIYLIDLMGLSTFQFNPQKNGQTLNCPLFPDPPPNLCFPDTGFKLALLAIPGIDSGGDGQISAVEARDFAGMISLPDTGLLNVGGLDYFSHTTDFYGDGNLIAKLPPLCRMGALEYLKLTDNALTDLPGISCLTSLIYLDVGENQIMTLPKPPTQLANLRCDGNGLSTLPSLKSLPNLWYLDISRNQLHQLPELPVPSSLFTFVCSQNALASLPDLSDQAALNFVAFDRNCLISATFSGLPDLQYIHLSSNELSVPPVLTNLPTLNFVDLSHNALMALPQNMSNLPNLVTVFAVDNRLVQIPDLTLFASLRFLDCSRNRLTQAPVISSFMDTVDLERNHLDVSECPTLVAGETWVTHYFYSVQGGFFLLNPELPLWPQTPSIIFDWVDDISNATFEYSLACP